MQRILLFGSLVCLLSGTQVWAQFNVENPPVNSTQSGISLISGWLCNANKVEVIIDNYPAVQIPYGTPRVDAQSVCAGKVNTGFGALLNWNDLGDGQHVVNVLADGQQIASIPITVVTFGVSFLRGATRTVTTGFGGCLTALQWRESLQNFVIAETLDCFSPLLGRWEFVTKTPSGNELDHYSLERIESRPLTAGGEEIEGIVGTDLDHGGEADTLRTREVSGSPSVQYVFILYSLVSSRCEIFIFNQTGPDAVQGVGTSYPPDPVTGCEELPSPEPTLSPMTGTRTAAALSEQQAPNTPAQASLQTPEHLTKEMRATLAEVLALIGRQSHP